jgi:PKD repeat protein
VGPAQGIYTSISGTSPNRIFNVEWRASYFSSGQTGNPVNFEIRLYENQSRIDFLYGTLNGNGSSATVGIQHGTSFTQFECSSGGLSSGLQLTFQPLPCLDGGGQCAIAPIAGFTATPTNGLLPLTVNFTNLTSAATNYFWDFGDGNSSTALNPIHTYTLPGSFTVSLTAIGSLGTNVFVRSNYVTVLTPPFISTQPSDQASAGGLPVTFTVAAGGTSPLIYQWKHYGTNVAGANSSSFTISAPALADVGPYRVAISNAYGFVISSNANLIILPIAGFGDNSFGQLSPPSIATNVVALAAGNWHSVALRGDGTVVAWGYNANGQTNVPSGLKDVISIAAGGYHNLALKMNHTVSAWGANFDGQSSPPPGLSNAVAVAAGTWHSLALRADGTVIAWGDHQAGQCDVPGDLSDAIAIAAAGNHSLALRSDGTVIAWGENTDGQGIYAGQSTPPPDLIGAQAIGAGQYHSLAIQSGNTLIAWGDNSQNQAQPPAGLSNVVLALGGSAHSVALKADTTVAAWGNNLNGQCNVAAGITNVLSIAAGSSHTLVLIGSAPTPPRVLRLARNGSQFEILLQTIAGKFYSLEYKTSLTASNWTSLPSVRGAGGLQLLNDSDAPPPRRFYRVRQQ